MGSILKSIARMKSLAFLLIIILAFSLTLLNNVTTLNYYTANKAKVYREFFDIDNTYLIRVQNENTDLSEYSILDDVGYDLMNLSNKKVFTNVFMYGWGNYNSSGLFESLSDDEQGRLDIKLVSEGFIKRTQVKLSSGRGLRAEDFSLDYKTQNIPIVLGDDFKYRYKLGDTFKMKVMDRTDESSEEIVYEVVGFVKKNQLISFSGKEGLGENYAVNNLIALTPIVKNLYGLSPAITLGDFGVFFERKPNMSVEEVMKSVNEVLNKYNTETGFKLQIRSSINLKQDLGLPIFLAERDSILMKMLAFVMILLSSLGLLSVILDQLQTRKKEFGIKIAHGAKYFDLSKEVFYEIFMICTLSSMLSFLIGFYINKDFNLSPPILAINFIYISVLSLLISIIPIIKLKSMATVELMRGK